MRWMEYLSQFDYDIRYVKGASNKVADSLSRYFQSDTESDVRQTYDFVNADSVLDPEGEDLPWNHIVEVRAISDRPGNRPPREAVEERGATAMEMATACKQREEVSSPTDGDDDPRLFELLAPGPE